MRGTVKDVCDRAKLPSMSNCFAQGLVPPGLKAFLFWVQSGEAAYRQVAIGTYPSPDDREVLAYEDGLACPPECTGGDPRAQLSPKAAPDCIGVDTAFRETLRDGTAASMTDPEKYIRDIIHRQSGITPASVGGPIDVVEVSAGGVRFDVKANCAADLNEGVGWVFTSIMSVVGLAVASALVWQVRSMRTQRTPVTRAERRRRRNQGGESQ